MSRPLIGLSTYREPARWGVWDASADLLPTAYATAVERAGGVPVLLPPVQAADAAASVTARLDALVVSGGADIDPARYDQAPHRCTVRWCADRDGWELALLDAAEATGLPTLGVCRGMQLLAVRAGGSLHQHVPDLVGHERHGPPGDAFGKTTVRTGPGSVAASLLGERSLVRCHHHQSVREHPGFAATAWAADGVVEAMEPPGERFCVGVQWHPEMSGDAELFRALVHAAGRRGASRGS